ncbi:hypothetical protein D9M68_440250 [compost metagenome]
MIFQITEFLNQNKTVQMKKERTPKSKPQSGNFIRYTGVAFQMLVTIALFSFIGYKIDAYKEQDEPVFTALLGVCGVIVPLIQVVRSLKSGAD